MDEMNFFQWVWFLAVKYHSYFLQGLWTTLLVSVLGTLLGFMVGFLAGMVETLKIRKEDSKIKKALLILPKAFMSLYVTLFRGTPMIVQAMIIYYGTYQMFGLDLPSFNAAILVVTLNTGAYMAETVRAGINSVDPGQMEGAKALGMPYVVAMFSVILPQTLKNIAPVMGNTFVANIKDTSVLNVIGTTELFYITKAAAGTYYRLFEAYTITAVIYLILTLVANYFLNLMEKKMQGNDNYEVLHELNA